MLVQEYREQEREQEREILSSRYICPPAFVRRLAVRCVAWCPIQQLGVVFVWAMVVPVLEMGDCAGGEEVWGAHQNRRSDDHPAVGFRVVRDTVSRQLPAIVPGSSQLSRAGVG